MILRLGGQDDLPRWIGARPLRFVACVVADPPAVTPQPLTDMFGGLAERGVARASVPSASPRKGQPTPRVKG